MERCFRRVPLLYSLFENISQHSITVLLALDRDLLVAFMARCREDSGRSYPVSKGHSQNKQNARHNRASVRESERNLRVNFNSDG